MPSGQAKETGTATAPLNDVMIAMDVVDTLRHDRALVERELNDEARRKDLIDRLREIYKGQGIEVPDHILEDGVKALEEERFTYKPPPGGNLSTQLAKLYVSRGSWGRYVGGAVLAVTLLWLANYFLFQRPHYLRQQAEAAELKTLLPARLKKLGADIASEARNKEIPDKAQALVNQGLNAAASKNLKDARTAETTLKQMLQQLRAVYDIRIVNRRGEVSGLWRIPQRNPNTYNFYLVVEAYAPNGQRLPQWIVNEETGKRSLVKTWAVRVERSVLAKVRADKEDDGIIQNAVAGRKKRGVLEPSWNIKTLGGAITNWN